MLACTISTLVHCLALVLLVQGRPAPQARRQPASRCPLRIAAAAAPVAAASSSAQTSAFSPNVLVRPYTLRKGDTLESIAQKRGACVQVLQRWQRSGLLLPGSCAEPLGHHALKHCKLNRPRVLQPTLEHSAQCSSSQAAMLHKPPAAPQSPSCCSVHTVPRLLLALVQHKQLLPEPHSQHQLNPPCTPRVLCRHHCERRPGHQP